jgi:hypothetical protein
MNSQVSKAIVIVLVSALVLSLYAPVTPMKVRAAGKVVAVDLTSREVNGTIMYRVKDMFSAASWTALYEQLKGNLTAAGYTVKEINGLTTDNLNGVDALITGKLRDATWNYTDAEVSAVAAWFKTGGKFLWVSSDSDFPEPYLNNHVGFKADQPNRLLAAIGSQLRIEWAAAADTVDRGAAGASYRVFANITEGGVNSQGFAANITAGTQRVLFHGPTFIIGFKNDNYVSFDQLTLGDNLQWLYRTTVNASGLDQDADPPKTITNGQRGQFVLAAAEKIPEGSTYSKVIATGESLLGDRTINTAIESGITMQGMTFVLNAFNWGTTVETIPSAGLDTTTILGIIVVVIVVVAAAFFFMRKKPSPK